MVAGLIVPGLPHPLLAPEQSPRWAELRTAYDAARTWLAAQQPDVLVLYSTQWPSVIGHQIQTHPRPKFAHVDQDWHALGTMKYDFPVDVELANALEAAARKRGLHARTVAYEGFPVDTGSVVALSLLDPESKLPCTILSCNMYADRGETLVLGKAARDAVQQTGRRAVFVAVTSLSARMFPHPIEPAQDHVSSQKDDEWNRKLLEILGEGRLEDASQLMRTLTTQANMDNKGKAFWWLAAALGQTNAYQAKVYGYGPLWGTGAAVVSLVPAVRAAGDHEFDEEDVEVHRGERSVLGGAASTSASAVTPAKPATDRIETSAAPRAVGAYPHARKVGDLVYVSGMGPRQPGTDAIPGGPVRDADGRPLPYDVRAQTHAVIANVRAVLESAGSSLDDVVDVSVFLIDMARDFAAFNEVYGQYFATIGATRTTVEVRALPTPIAVELKVIARPRPSP